MTRVHSIDSAHEEVERRLVVDAPAARLEVPLGLHERIIDQLDERRPRPALLTLRPWMLAAASLLVGWMLVIASNDSGEPAKIELGPWTDAFKVGRWVAPSDGAVHQRVDAALIGEWQAMVTDASRAATTVLDGFARPLRGWNINDQAR